MDMYIVQYVIEKTQMQLSAHRIYFLGYPYVGGFYIVERFAQVAQRQWTNKRFAQKMLAKKI